MQEINNVTSSITQSINSIFSNIFSSVDNNIYAILDKITFIDTTIIEQSNFIKLFGENSSSGILLVCNSLVLGFLLFYAIQYLFSHITYSKTQPPVQFILKTIILVGLMNGSYWICTQIINIVSLSSKAICDVGQSIFKQDISFSNFIASINNYVYHSEGGIDVMTFDGMIKAFTTVGFINLIFSYSLRYVMIQVFVLIFPFSLLCAINEKTSWLFKSLIKAFISLLLEQILISLILVIAFSFSFSDSDTISKILYIGVIYSLMKANTYMYMIFGGISTTISSGINMITNQIR